MSGNITPENERYLEELVAGGRYGSRDAALNAGIELLKSRQSLIARLENSRGQLDAGDSVEFDDESLSEFFEQIRRRAIQSQETQKE